MSAARNSAPLATKRNPRDRRSIAYLPSPDTTMNDRENATTNVFAENVIGNENATAVGRSKSSRSLSIGPGGLEALREDAGNKRKVGDIKHMTLSH